MGRNIARAGVGTCLRSGRSRIRKTAHCNLHSIETKHAGGRPRHFELPKPRRQLHRSLDKQLQQDQPPLHYWSLALPLAEGAQLPEEGARRLNQPCCFACGDLPRVCPMHAAGSGHLLLLGPGHAIFRSR